MKFVVACLFFLLSIGGVYGQKRYIILSDGGGVTGNAEVYKIESEGTVLKGRGLGEITFDKTAKMKRCKAKKYFRKTKSLLTENPSFNHPGNMYSTITLIEDNSEHKMSWGDASHVAPEKATKLYQKIKASIAKLTFSDNLRK